MESLAVWRHNKPKTKKTFMCPRSIAGVPSSQALPGYLITTPPFVCVPAVIGVLACGFQTKKKIKENKTIKITKTTMICVHHQ